LGYVWDVFGEISPNLVTHVYTWQNTGEMNGYVASVAAVEMVSGILWNIIPLASHWRKMIKATRSITTDSGDDMM
jgi:Na+-transporting NADH:ubiquinone oxidoreductase subunit NqrB